MTRRVHLELTYSPIERSWMLRENRILVRKFHGLTKRTAETMSRAIARQMHRNGQLVQLRIHLLNGRIEEEATYGADPRRYVG